jgi:hypothetical protein
MGRVKFGGCASFPMDVGPKWAFFGDSQTSGRESDETKSPIDVWARVWETKYPSVGPATPYTDGLDSDPYRNGVSGRSLFNTGTMYDGRDALQKGSFTWVHFQESGDQNHTGQVTVGSYGATFDRIVGSMRLASPLALISTETAFSFGRGTTPISPSETFRDWAAYNVELRARVATWAGSGVTIPIAEVDRDILLLGSSIGSNNVWFQRGDANEFHYKAVGNLMVALSMFKALRYRISMSDLADIPTGQVSSLWKQACLDVYNAN